MTPEYIGEYQGGIERIASPISIVPSQRPGDLSSVTEETFDAIEHSEPATTSNKEIKLQNKFQLQPKIKSQNQNFPVEESDIEEEEEEFSEESEYTETSFASNMQDNLEYKERYEEVYNSFSDNWRREYDIRASGSFSQNISNFEIQNQTVHKLDPWVRMLELPNNQQKFYELFNKGVHPAFEHLLNNYPLKERDLFEKYIRILSCIGHWCPFLAQVDFIPIIVFPFVKVMDHSEVIM